VTIWHILAIIYAIIGYINGKKLIKERWQNAGIARYGGFKSPVRLYRDGEDAVSVGKFAKYSSIAILLIIFTDILGFHDMTFSTIIAHIIIYNTVIFFLYLIKSDPPKEKKKKHENQID